MATKLANRDITGFQKDNRSTKATKSKLPQAVDQIEGECEFSELWQHQIRHNNNNNLYFSHKAIQLCTKHKN